MRQLSGMDNMFLQLERGNNYTHVASLGIYDPSTAEGGHVRFKNILRFFAARIDKFPLFRRRLVSVPLSLDRPYWIEDAAIDLEFHVRHIALPHPGDWRQLCIQVARLHSRPLDRSKPLWEAYVIEGLHNIPGVPPGSFAMYLKIHHSMIDGESGTELNKAIHSLTPDVPELLLDESLSSHTAEDDPGAVELYSRALVHNLSKVPDIARFSLGTASRLAGLGAGAVSKMRAGGGESPLSVLEVLRSGDLTSLLPKMPPPTRFSEKVSAHRVFEAVGLSLEEIRTVRQQVGEVTINDLFLAVVGGALNRYLGAKGELPETSMSAMVPMTLRGADKMKDAGNQVGFTIMPVHSEIADPLTRLRAIRADATAVKQTTEALGKGLVRELLEHLPNLASAAVARGIKLPKISLIVSNVRGPDVALYMAGAKMVRFLPISVAVDGSGLNVTAFSYHGTMWICAVSCRDMLPDPAFFAECMRSAFRELVEAAESLARSQARPRAKPEARSGTKTKTKTKTRTKARSKPAPATKPRRTAAAPRPAARKTARRRARPA